MGSPESDDTPFAEIIALIEGARAQAANAEVVRLYWRLGEYISGKLACAEWGAGVVSELASELSSRCPGVRGFARRNLFRMRQFFEAYPDPAIVSSLLTQLPWTHHLIILDQARPVEARTVYIRAAVRERWSSRELERQIQSGRAFRAAQRRARAAGAVTRLARGSGGAEG
jgi:predicted nuclease of restriction endonuclease-like (RecB) superfamily